VEDISVFTDKESEPAEKQLAEKLGETYPLWNQVVEFVMKKYPFGMEEWNYPGKKYGWNLRIKDKKRAIIYLLPREGYFKTAFVFGDKASEAVWNSNVSDGIKLDLKKATKYAEGRGIRIDVKNEFIMPDLQRLVEIKLAN
jgi:hypothetical protein